MNLRIMPDMGQKKRITFGSSELPEPILKKSAEVTLGGLQALRKLLDGPDAPPYSKLTELKNMLADPRKDVKG